MSRFPVVDPVVDPSDVRRDAKYLVRRQASQEPILG